MASLHGKPECLKRPPIQQQGPWRCNQGGWAAWSAVGLWLWALAFAAAGHGTNMCRQQPPSHPTVVWHGVVQFACEGRTVCYCCLASQMCEACWFSCKACM